jgi:hypothetical protein
MMDFFASIFEWWGINPLYAGDLGVHLRGYDLHGHYDGTPWYIYLGWSMIGLTLLTFALFYVIIDKEKFKRAWHWWIMALVLFIINFSIGFTIPYNDLNGGTINKTLHINTADCLGFAFSIAFWSLILLAFLTILPLRKAISNNCRNTTFWKP